MDKSNHASIDRDDSERALLLHVQSLVVVGDGNGADLAAAWSWLWRGRVFILAFTLVVAALSVVYVLTAPVWYRAQVVLAPSDQSTFASGLAGSLGSLGSLGGLVGLDNLRMGGGTAVESIATLASADFTSDFIETNNLLPVLFAEDWNAAEGKWGADVAGKEPDIRDAIRLFDERVRTVREDKKTGLVTLSIEWKDPVLAAQWANLLVERLNSKARDRLLSEADAHVDFLKRELADTDVLALEQAIGRLLESELQKAMIARVRRDAAFRVLDHARVPKYRSHPKRIQVVAIATAAALLLGSIAVLVWYAIRSRESSFRRVVDGQ